MVAAVIRPRSETDIITDFESVVGGSNPPEGTNQEKSNPRQRIPKPKGKKGSRDKRNTC